jgi:hypothetical protein
VSGVDTRAGAHARARTGDVERGNARDAASIVPGEAFLQGTER